MSAKSLATAGSSEQETRRAARRQENPKSNTDELRESAAKAIARTVAFYGLSAAGNLLFAVQQPGALVVADAAGVSWRVSDITATCAVVTVFTMGVFALLAWVRLMDRNGKAD